MFVRKKFHHKCNFIRNQKIWFIKEWQINMGKLHWNGRELTETELKFIAEFLRATVKGTTDEFYLQTENVGLAKSFGIVKE